jgi:methylenetetrahydrofolate dehydrogenase (NADP+)/methenyltetrahydrofolate cyclohydrolase
MASAIRQIVSQDVANLKQERQITPGLAAILVGDDPASVMYVNLKEKACKEVGIFSKIFRLPINVSREDLFSLITELNHSQQYHGILVQLPLPSVIEPREVVQYITPSKDIEGLHPENIGKLVLGDPIFIPCVAASVQQMILSTGHDPEGKHAVICGNSVSAGGPIATLLMQNRPGAGATVTICHEKTVNLAELTLQADILISAVGIPNLITSDMVKDGVIAIDVGISRIKDPSRPKGYRVVGDLDFDSVAKKASAITPVPGGVGPMTIAMLLSNTFKAAYKSTL